MATSPLGADSAHVIHPNRFPPAAAARVASRMLDRFNREELSNAIEVLVTMLDIWDGDPDEETDDPDLEPTGDEKDAAWIEWNTMRGSQKRGSNILATQHEDDEDDDPAGQYDEDCYTGTRPNWHGPGCVISDPDHEHDGREESY